ncbi:MAG: ATP-binding protein [Acidobacteriota bacterium]
MKRPPWRLGLRGELLILPPTALLLLMVLSTFTLSSYRGGLFLLAEERRAEAARLASEVAARVEASAMPTAADLRRGAPAALGVDLLDARGVARTSFGTLTLETTRLPPLSEITAAQGFGPDGSLPYSVMGVAPLGPSEARRYVRLELDAAELGAQLRGVRVLSWVVLPANGAILILLLFFLRHLLRPIDALFDRAERFGRPEVEGEDEVGFLLRTFERALETLSEEGPPASDELEALRRTLAPSLDSGVLLLDAGGQVVALNEVGGDLLGCRLEKPGTALEEVLVGHPRLTRLLASAIAGGGGVTRQEIDLDRGATIGVTLHPLRRDDGAVRGYLALFADLTESRRQAREVRLSESLEGLGELAGGVAHELRNSLATLKGYLTLIEKSPGEDSIQDFLAEIRRESDHLQRILEDFLTFARPGSARIERFSLLAMARRAAGDPALAEAAVEVVCESEESRLLCDGDAQLLERAVRNLLHNAVEAERAAGREPAPELRLRRLGEELEVAVLDRGVGVPEELQDRLFRPFVTGRAEGVGLGLALAHRIVSLHGGRLSLSPREGGGSAGRIRIPVDAIVTNRNNSD